MRLAIILLLVCSTAAAAQRTHTPIVQPLSPDVLAAEALWAVAENERDAKAAIPKWQAAALAFDKAIASAGTHKAEAAYAAVLAWKNAIASTTPVTKAQFSKAELGLIAAVDVYLPLAPADEVPAMHFLRARMFYAHDRFADAVPGFETVVSKFPADDVAEYSATMLLDALNRQSKFAELRDWVTKMRGTPKLIAKRPELVDTLNRLHVQLVRKDAEAAEASGEHIRCGRLYRDLAVAMPKYERLDEVLFNAGVCFERGGAKADAAEHYIKVARIRKSPIRDAAKQRLINLHP